MVTAWLSRFHRRLSTLTMQPVSQTTGKNRIIITSSGQAAILAAMLNDYADEQGWPERYTSRELGRVIGWEEYSRLSETVMDLVYSSLSSAEPSEETEPKN